MSLQGVFQECFPFGSAGAGKPVVVEASEAAMSSDAGLIPIRQFDEIIGLTRRFADALDDGRDPARIVHSFLEMVRVRMYGILAGYEDQNDHDTLRSDPVFKIIADRSPVEGDLASQPTHSRFENAISVRSLMRLRDVFIDQFIDSFDEPPALLTLDVDPFDDPAHGAQQLIMFHGYYGQYQYLPRVMTCAENDQVVMFCLLFGTANPTLGADDDLEYLTGRLRAVWPDVRIHLRADSAYGVPLMFDVCERLSIQYSFGVRMNATLKKASDERLTQATADFESTERKQRVFESLDYRAGSWPTSRWTIIKVEVHENGTNRRAIVTNRPGARVLPAAAYDEYADRGESENRNKELKRELKADRLSDHRYMANLFRLALHCAAHNLLVQLRQSVASPPETPSTSEGISDASALKEPARHRWFSRRRREDPLGEGHACTWQTRLIKVAAEVSESARRIVVRLSGSWPHLSHYEEVSKAILALPPSG